MCNNVWTTLLLGVFVVKLRGQLDDKTPAQFLERRLDQTLTTSLFCFTVVPPHGYQASLLPEQRFFSVGLFGCDGHTVISNVSAIELFGGIVPAGIDVSVIDDSFEELNPELHNGVMKASAFIKVWAKLLKDGMISRYDWTVKLEVDTVFIPAFLEYRLHGRCSLESCKPVYLKSSSLTSTQSSRGAIEVLSKTAVMYFVANGWSCESRMDASQMSESEYLTTCLASLMIPSETEPKLLLDGGAVCDADHAAFRPLKTWTSYLDCLYQAGQTPTTSTAMPPFVPGFLAGNPTLYHKIAIVLVFGVLVGLLIIWHCWRQQHQHATPRDIQMAAVPLDLNAATRGVAGPEWTPIAALDRADTSPMAFPSRAPSSLSNWGFKPTEQVPTLSGDLPDRESLMQWLR